MDKSRFDAFTDGVFAIAITLLVLEIHIPELKDDGAASLEDQMTRWLLHLWPSLLTYALSFATVGIIWLNHHATFAPMKHLDRTMLALNLVLLATVCLVPYPTALLARYGALPASTAFYGAVFLAMGCAYGALFWYGARLQHERSGVRMITVKQFWIAQIGTVTYAVGTLVAFAFPIAALALFVATTIFYAVEGIFAPQTSTVEAA